MKTFLITCILLISSPRLFAESGTEHQPDPSPQDLSIGDSAEKVKEIMGEPNGKMEAGDFSIYYYKLGNVKMKSGKVSALNLMSAQEWAEKQQAKAAARENRRMKGEELLQSIKEDDQFAELPAETRFKFWKQFREDYPEIDIYVLYAQAKIEAEKVAEEKRAEERIAALERRVQQAENEARRAAEAAETQRLFEQTRRNSRRYPSVIVYPNSYIRSRKVSVPRTKTYDTMSTGQYLNFRLHRDSRQNSTHGFTNGQNGVMRIQSSDGFIRDFY